MYSEWAKDEIRIDRLEVFAHHGVFPEETKEGQVFYVNAVLYTDVHRACREDDLTYSVDYGAVCSFITEWMQTNTCRLLETVAEKLSIALLLRYDLICALDLEVLKPHAPIELPFGCVSVKVHRGWHRAYVGLGSNMGDRERYIQGAVKALGAHPLIRMKAMSELIVTKPYGGVEQEDFLNGVLELETLLNPEEFLKTLHEIENAADRKREIHWGPRTLDLDILLFDALCYESDTLVIPHPDMENRSFVMEPLAKIAPNMRHPVIGKTMAALFRELEVRQDMAGNE